MVKEEFKDIAPFDDSEFKEKMATLVTEPGFEHAVKYAMPMVDYPIFAQQLLTIETKDEFQYKIMLPFLEMLAQRTTSGITMDGVDDSHRKETFTYISNHRAGAESPGCLATALRMAFLRRSFTAGAADEPGDGRIRAVYACRSTGGW